MHGIIIDTSYENIESYVAHILTYQVMMISQYQHYKINQQMQIVLLTNISIK